MAYFRVGLCYSGYRYVEVEAQGEGDALDKAITIAYASDPTITEWERWHDADTIELLGGEGGYDAE
jgi:hypothetical protein